jgi:hypothetical protein
MRVSLFPASLSRCWRQALLGGGALAISTGLLGCGSGEDRVPVQPVRGQVLLEGKPVPHAHVVLHPLEHVETARPRPQAKVNPDGSFAVSTYETGDGAPPGEYAVTVQCWLASVKNPEAPPVNYLPVRYSRTSSSGLRVQIREGDTQLPPLHLKK